MIRALGFIWRWSWLVTLPVTVALFHWMLATAHRYHDFGVRHRVTSEPFRLWNIGHMEFDHMIRRLSRTVSPRSSTQDGGGTRELETVSLFVPAAALSELDSELPHSGFKYVDGGLWDRGKIREVQVRYRGDNAYHWGYHKKSWRVKTKKGSLFKGMRRFNLVAPRTPEILNNHLSYRLGSALGLISPLSEMVNVSVNGAPTGIRILTEQLSEITLRRHRLMPGDLYSGELLGREAYYGAGLRNRIFEHPGLWEKVAFNNHFEETSMAPLRRLTRLLQVPWTEAIQTELTSLVDVDAFGRFSALEILLSTIHVDDIHNWRLYYDPWRQLFVPVVWDLVGWHQDWLPGSEESARLDVITSRLHSALHQNADFLRARQDALSSFFGSGKDGTFLAEVDEIVHALGGAVEQDPNLVTSVSVLTPDAAREAMDGLRHSIRKMFREVRDGYVGGDGAVRYRHRDGSETIALQVSGRRPVNRLQLRYRKALDDEISAEIRYWRDDRVVERDVSGALLRAGTQLELRIPLLACFVPSFKPPGPDKLRNYLDVRPGYYELVLDGLGGDVELLEVLVDRGEDELEPATRVAGLERSSFSGMFALVPERPVRKPVVLQGDVLIDRVLEIDDEVIVRPGTTLRMEPGASVILRGRVWAKGTPEQPIRVIPARRGQDPWGTFALQGPESAGSTFGHCEFVGGGGLKGDLFEYSAMFSIHDVDGVVVEHSRFSDSVVVDDMVHAVYSRVRFSDCEFERSLFDAVDLDITEGVVERCVFKDSGNDALDLMTSNVVVLDTKLQGNRDKGISVGEDTKLLAIRCEFLGNNIGVESKDSSVAVLYNAELRGNGLALNAYDKNWQYRGGGLAYLYKVRLEGNTEMIRAEKGSRVWVYDSYLDQPLDPEIQRVEVDDTVDTDPDITARIQSLWRYPAEREQMGGFADGYWARAKPTARGAAGIGR